MLGKLTKMVVEGACVIPGRSERTAWPGRSGTPVRPPGLRVCDRPALSREEHAGRRGRVPVLLAEDYPRAAGHVAYVCGRPEFVTDTMKALMKGRLFPRDIYREDFYDAADRAAGTGVISSP